MTGKHIPWKAIAGPLVASIAAALVWLIDRHAFNIPNPAAVYLATVVFAAYVGGMVPGLVTGALTILYAILYLSEDGKPLAFNPDDAVRIILMAISTPVVALLVGYLERRARLARAFEVEARQGILRGTRELITLRAALDEVDHGILLLDAEMNSRFINRAFRRLFALPDEKADTGPSFADLIGHGRSTNTYDVSDADMPAYVAARIAEVRDGTMPARDIRFRDGRVIRLMAKVLPAGGRMLTYGDVTDLVQKAEDMEVLATTDSLTGLRNRREFMRVATGELARRRRYEQATSVLMLDIDHFKRVNDRYGHDIGDRALTHLAQQCRASLRTTDTIGRLGGEEFAVILPETEMTAAIAVAEKLRLAISETAVPTPSGMLHVTVSIGAATAHGAEDVAGLLKRADDALYRAKQSGRNRVVAADDPG